MKKMSVCCCTYNRPAMLKELIQSYLQQTYPIELRELIILDDAGQYGDMRGDGWQIVSFSRRFSSLGEKRNTCVSLASHESDWIVLADDDDIYFPHWLESHAKNLQQGAEWSFSNRVYISQNNKIIDMWRYPISGWFVHPTCAFTKELFWKVGGYPHLAWKEDHYLFTKIRSLKIVPTNCLREGISPFMIFRRNENPHHVHTTGISLKTYQCAYPSELFKASLNIGWKRDYLQDALNFEESKKYDISL